MNAMVTFATGPHVELLEIATPSFESFADAHGYDLIFGEVGAPNRPGSWMKLPLLREALQDYEQVLWVDADIVIMDATEDVTAPAHAWQAMVRHHTNDGEVPNCAVWLVRQPMAPILDRMWSMGQYLNHGWWEQAAMLDLLGYQHDPRPTVLAEPTDLYHRTHWLDNSFNVHANDRPQPGTVRFAHATMYSDRSAVMREWETARTAHAVAA